LSAPPISYEQAQTTIDVINECLAEGFGLVHAGHKRTASAEAAERMGITQQTMGHRVRQIKRLYDLAPDPDAFAPRRNTFEVSGLPHDGDPSAEELIQALKIRHQSRKALHDAAKLRQVQVNVEGPIAIAFFGDPHVDDPGCAWGDLERDVAICRDTEGVLAVDVGDDSNNWVGRLAKLYANQEVTSKQALVLIEWLMTQLPWLMRVVGNHDCIDYETEVLTLRGWLDNTEIKDDDHVLSIDENGNAVWTEIFEVIRRENSEPMVSIEARGLSLNATPNHRVLHKGKINNSKWTDRQFKYANDLPGSFKIPLAAPSGREDYPLSDDWIALTGWFLTDGGVRYSSGTPYVTFYQSKPSPDLDSAIAACGLTPNVITRVRNITHVCGKELKRPPLPSREYRIDSVQSRKCMEIFESKGTMPSWVWRLSDRQFTILLEAIIAGDGAWASGGTRAAAIHKDKAFLDSLQAACVSHGWRAHLSVARGKDWRLNVCEKPELQVTRRKSVKEGAPSDKVWCLRVPHGNFMIRRDNKAHFTGNSWNTDKGDVGEYIHRITGALGIYDLSARMQLNLPSGHHAKVHVRHDFPGGSQFNPAHAMVRETLFGHRDHIMACGHRHTTGYIPIWHNDPERLCHGFRLGTYKDMDHYAKEKGFQEGNWARSMAAVIDPEYAHDPVRYIRPCFSLEEMAEYLTWRRSKWSANRVPNL